MAEVASAYVSLLPSAKGFGGAASKQIDPQMSKAGKRGGGVFAAGLKSAIGPATALLGTAAVGGFLKGSIEEAREAQKVGALTESVIKSTGGAAKVTAKQVGDLATKISLKTGVDDEAIQSGANLLLTFKNVRNEAGKGAKIFDRATQAASDLSAAGFGDLAGTSKQLGKALNDPIKGISALGRSGVTFSEAQKKQIKGFVATNDLLSAQKIILKEVESQVGGAAAATATSGEKAAVAMGNLKEQIGTALLPVIDRLATATTTKVIPAISSFIAGLQDGTGAGGRVAKALTDVYNAGLPVAQTIVKIVSAFAGMPGTTQKVILLAGAMLLLKSRFGDSLPSIQSFNREAAVAGAKSLALRGGALAAGAGLATLSSKAGGASTDLGSLSLIGSGVATGFAVGGPWGAAIGGGSALLAIFAGRSRAAAAAQAKFDAAGKTVAATLNQQTGALTAATRATAAKELADLGAFTAGKKVGVSYKDTLDAALGNAGAIKRVDAATKAYLQTQNGNFQGLQRAAKVTNTLSSAVHGSSGAIAGQRKSLSQANAALAASRAATDKTGKAFSVMATDAAKAATKMAAAGDEAGRGFSNGIGGWLGVIRGQGQMIADIVAKAARDKLKIKSPSRVMMAIGGFAGQGLAIGLANKGSAVAAASSGLGQNVLNGLREGSSGLDTYLREVEKKITDSLAPRKANLKRAKPGASKKQRAAVSAFNDRERKNVARYNDAAKKAIKTQKAAVDQLRKSLSGLSGQIDTARSDLNSIKDARASLADQTASSISGELSLTETGGKKLSFATVAGNVSGLAARAKAFAGKLRAMLAAGIPAGLVREVAALGTVQGIGVADALLSGSQQQIGQLASDYAGLDTYSKQVGDIVAGGMFDAGIQAQQGLLNGLLNDAAIQKSADQLAKKLTKAVKKSLGIKSPSRVFQNEVGRYLPAGIVAGIDDGQRALDRRVAGMVRVAKIGTVRPGDFAGGVAASTPTENHFHVTAPAGVDQPAMARMVAEQFMWKMATG